MHGRAGAPLPPFSPMLRPYHRYIFSIRQHNTLRKATVFAFSIMVSLSKIAFAVLLLPYLLALARCLSATFKQAQPDRASLGLDGWLLVVHTVVGFVVPTLCILNGL